MNARIIITGTNADMPKDAVQRATRPVCRNCEGRGFELIHWPGTAEAVRQDCPECKSVNAAEVQQ